jgi:hypothetical protein
MQAQKMTGSPIGEYYLQGVRETASAFKLNKDSTFWFFFSYGALDRVGEGRWKTEGNTLVLNSEKKPAQDFTMVQSGKNAGTGITLQITGGSAQIKQFVHAVVKTGNATEQASANEEGVISFKTDTATTIILLFELCPEKQSIFTIVPGKHNFFEFRFEPTIMDVVFDNFRLNLDEKQLTGGNPVIQGKTFSYERAGSNN